MFPTQHDITFRNLDACIGAIRSLLDARHQILIVTKPKVGCVAQICQEFFADERKDRILFRFTIGSLDEGTLQRWEPGASSPWERLCALRLARFHYGFATSVSCEPLLTRSVEETRAMVETFLPAVSDAVWIGRMNYAKQRLALNGAPPGLVEEAERLAAIQSDEFYRSLYEVYHNDDRVKWKESVKRSLGIAVPTKAGLDI